MRDWIRCGGVVLAGTVVCATTLLGALAVHAQASAYRYAVPAGWQRSVEGDTEVLVPTALPAGSAQLLLLAPKPLAGDFFQQFDAERTQLEQFWRLRDPAPVDPQRGTGPQGPWAAFFASYDSDGGPRYMSFLARAIGQQWVLAVFVAADHDSFNRVAPQATHLFTSLQLAR